jgi:Fe-S cluster biosynthesis and repair protein YggX
MSIPGSDRIAQFEKMASADPSNEMAHFSLGNAYLQAGRHAEAAQSLSQCIELSPEMSKAYQLCAQAMIGAGWVDRAVDVLTRGIMLAASKGDRMPEQAMVQLMKSIGREPPKVERPAVEKAPVAPGQGGFTCGRTGRTGTKLSSPPFKGPVGAWIQSNISAETWDEWIRQGTKVINELRLDLSRDRDQDVYDQHMREYIGLDDETLAQLRGGVTSA